MDKDKFIDESWKEQTEKEKEILGDETHDPDDVAGVEVNFLNYLMSLGFQAMVFLGEVPNPTTDKQEKNLPQAKLLIDTLVMLRDKTKGNLNPQEENFLNAAVYELEMKYVEVFNADQKKG